MKVTPIKKEDLLTEIGRNSRVIRLTVEKFGTETCEVSKMAVANVIQSMTEEHDNEFFFKVEEVKNNE